MSEIEAVNFRQIKFTRDTQVDYKSGNPIINCVFKQFDTNGDAKFDDEEWANYQEYEAKMKERQEKIEKYKQSNDKIISHYQKQLEKLHNKGRQLDNKIKELTADNSWEKLLEFEKNHPSVSREGYTNDNELPEGAVKYDISAFEMGIYDETNGCFKEETYKTGYLIGFETLSEEEKKEYLSLLDKASEMINELMKIDEAYESLGKKEDKLLSMIDMAQNGIVNKIGSDEYENEMYQQYTQIRSKSNPFYSQIKETEAKYNTLYRKGNRTEEEDRLLEQYQIQLQSLKQASANWSIADTRTVNKFEIKTGTSYQLTHSLPSEESIKESEGEINFAISANGSYTDENVDLQGSVNISRELRNKGLFNNKYTSAFQVAFKRGTTKYKASVNCDINQDNRNYVSSLGYSNGNFSADVTNTQSYTRSEDDFDKSNTTEINAGYTFNQYNVSANINHNKEMTTYTLNAGMNDGIETKIGTFTPSVSNTYSNLSGRFTTSPSLSYSKEFLNNNDLTLSLQADDNYNWTYGKGKPEHENNLTVAGRVKFKGLNSEIKYNNMYSSGFKSNTYGASIKYDTPEAGSFGLEYSHSRTNDGVSIEKTDIFSFNYSASIDTLKKWLGIR